MLGILDSSVASDTIVMQLGTYVPGENSIWIINNRNFLNNIAIDVSGY